MPYQIFGYASAWQASEFFFHSSHANAPFCFANAQISVALMDAQTPPFSHVPMGFTGYTVPLLLIIAPMGEGTRSSSSPALTRVADCSFAAAPQMPAHGCGSSH